MKANILIDKIYSTLSGNNADKVSDKIKHRRLAICRNCKTKSGKKMVLSTGNCRKCGCFVNLKTEYKSESCPIGKW